MNEQQIEKNMKIINSISKKFVHYNRCRNRFLKLTLLTKLYKYILSKLKIITSLDFEPFNRVIAVIYKTCFEFRKQKNTFEPNSDQEMQNWNELQEILDQVYEKLNEISIPLNSFDKLFFNSEHINLGVL